MPIENQVVTKVLGKVGKEATELYLFLRIQPRR